MTDNNSSNADDALRWQSMSVEELEREYSPSSAIGGNYQPFIEEYSTRSAASKAAVRAISTLRYGSKPANLIDCVCPTQDADNLAERRPLLAFVHGGYWQEGSRTDSLFGCDVFADNDICYAAIGYTLAPDATLEEMVRECRAAVVFLAEHADSLRVDENKIFLAGSSAGAHLAAMCCCPIDDPTVTMDVVVKGGDSLINNSVHVAGLILMSGIFELEPLVATYVNDKVAMTLQQAQYYSPMRRDLSLFPDTIVTWGEVETQEFKRQSRLFAQKLDSAAVQVEAFETAERNHFNIVHDLADAGTVLGRRLRSLIEK